MGLKMTNKVTCRVLVDSLRNKLEASGIEAYVFVCHMPNREDRVCIRVYAAESWVGFRFVHTYVHLLPWARGWSLFVSNSYLTKDYTSTPTAYTIYSRPVPNKRNVIGPDKADLEQLTKITHEIIIQLICQVWPQRLAKHYLHKLWKHS